MSLLPSHALRAFRHRAYRLYFIGQLISLVGTWMTQVASGWLIYRLSGSEFILGLSYFAGNFPSFLLGPIGGVLVDRFDRRKVFFITTISSMLQSFSLALLLFMRWESIPALLALQALQGMINTIDMPARTSFLSSLVPDRADLANAIALNSAMFNLARLVGPAIAGFIIAASGEGWCFAIDGLTYIPVIFLLATVRVEFAQVSKVKRKILDELVEGVRYATRHSLIRTMLVLVSLMSFFGMQYATLMPAVVKEAFQGGPELLGLMMSAAGTGAFAGSVLLAVRRNVTDLPRLLVPSTLTVALSMSALSFAPPLPWAFLVVGILGGALILTLASCHTIVQTVVDDDKRGRVMSLYGMAFLGTVPLGAIAIGYIAEHSSPLTALTLGGAGCMLASWVTSKQSPDSAHEFLLEAIENVDRHRENNG